MSQPYSVNAKKVPFAYRELKLLITIYLAICEKIKYDIMAHDLRHKLSIFRFIRSYIISRRLYVTDDDRTYERSY